MNHELFSYRGAIELAIQEVFSERNSPFDDIDLWSTDVRDRLLEYALRGKLLRGALVPYTFELYSPSAAIAEDASVTTEDAFAKKGSAAAKRAGAAMELLQSFLLVHDDIMDQDEIRRGRPAMHAQYAEIAPSRVDRSIDPGQYGVSMGICVGDVAAFHAMHILSSLEIDDDVRNAIIARTTREIMLVGLAQMQDVHHGYVAATTTDLVKTVYTYKTGRYTFSLPMTIGAMIAGVESTEIDQIIILGESLGRIFQIRDDRLGVMENEGTTGKPAGSDIREDKKTVYRELLFEAVPNDDPVRNLFGKRDLSAADVETVRRVLREKGILDAVENMVSYEANTARSIVDSLTLGPDARASLHGLIDFNMKRSV